MSAICPHGIVCDYVLRKTVVGGQEISTGGDYWHNEDEPCTLRWVPEDVSDELGKTGYCLHGYHERCSHRIGGPADGGILLSTGELYRCPCVCHAGHAGSSHNPTREALTQLALFPENGRHTP